MQEKDNYDLISVVLPTYNRGYIIEKAIASVIRQTYENWELIVVDDASADDTWKVMEQYKDKRIKYIREEENRGANYCRNAGVRYSHGKYIAFLDSDNYWEKEKLEIQLKEIRSTGDDVALVFCDELIDFEGRQYVFPEHWNYKEMDIGKTLYERNIIDTNTALVKRECFEKAGGFDEKMPRIQDWELFFRLVNKCGYRAVYIPQCLNNNIIQQNSITKQGKKYVDAIFHMLGKYPDEFHSIEQIEHHIREAFGYAPEEQAYICGKICELYSHKPKLLQDVMGKMIDLIKGLKRQLAGKAEFYSLLYQWKRKGPEAIGRAISREVSEKQNIRLAIYGLGGWGELFYEEIKNFPIHISYGIDKKIEEFHSLVIKRPEDELEEVDLIVVTVFREYESIKAELRKKYSGKIISIESLIEQAQAPE